MAQSGACQTGDQKVVGFDLRLVRQHLFIEVDLEFSLVRRF